MYLSTRYGQVINFVGFQQRVAESQQKTLTAVSKILKGSPLVEGGKIQRTLVLKLMEVEKRERNVPYDCSQILKYQNLEHLPQKYYLQIVHGLSR